MAARRKRTDQNTAEQMAIEMTRDEARAKVRAGETVQVGDVIVTGQRVVDGMVEWEVDGEWRPRYEIERDVRMRG